MQRRQFIAAAGTGSLFALAGCIGSARDPSLQTQVTSVEGSADGNIAGNRLQVRGTGQIETEPNRATIDVSVEAQESTASAVRDVLATDADALRQALIEYGIPEENITTRNYSIRDRRQERGYEGVHAYAIDIDDVDAVGEVIDLAVEAGADRIGRIQFTVDDETRAALRDDAMEIAIDNARTEAEMIARAKNLTLGSPQEIVSGDSRVSPWMPRLELAADDAAAPPTAIDAGLVTVNADVQITYRFS